jgi:hypothetical protein
VFTATSSVAQQRLLLLLFPLLLHGTLRGTWSRLSTRYVATNTTLHKVLTIPL